jgi:stage IV sporulation protein B
VLQDGKLVGAVTHVLINDPQRGYGIFADSMLKEGRMALEAETLSRAAA